MSSRDASIVRPKIEKKIEIFEGFKNRNLIGIKSSREYYFWYYIQTMQICADSTPIYIFNLLIGENICSLFLLSECNLVTDFYRKRSKCFHRSSSSFSHVEYFSCLSRGRYLHVKWKYLADVNFPAQRD